MDCRDTIKGRQCTSLFAALALALVAACSGTEDAPGPVGGGAVGAGGAGGAPAGGGGQGGLGFGAGGNAGGAGGHVEKCRSVDLVISVDASTSMAQELSAFRTTVFPQLAAELVLVGDGLDDFRVSVLDACPSPANYHTRGASVADCGFSSGEVWMASDSTDLVGEFSCVGDLFLGDVNCTGHDDDEQPVTAATLSLEPPWSTGANAGFSRDDAVLVVIAITDSDEQPTGGAPTGADEIRNRLLATKSDDRQVVFVGVGASQTCTGVYGAAAEATKLKQITDMFIAEGRGVFWDLCAGNLEDSLDSVMAVIDSACEDSPPR